MMKKLTVMKLLLLFAAIHLLILHQYYKDKKAGPLPTGNIPERGVAKADSPYAGVNERQIAINDSLATVKKEKKRLVYAVYMFP